MKSIFHFLRRGRLDREFTQEVESHLEEKVAELMETGMSEPEALAQARREFGNITLCKEISREVWGWTWLETLIQDVRYGARMLRKNPGFTAVAATTLALGIAVNSTIFSVISGWLLKKPAVSDADRVVAVVSTNARRAVDRGRISAADFWLGGARTTCLEIWLPSIPITTSASRAEAPRSASTECALPRITSERLEYRLFWDGLSSRAKTSLDAIALCC